MTVESSESSSAILWEDKAIIKSKLDLSDEKLWELIEKDNFPRERKRSLKNKEKFLYKVYCYIESIYKSEVLTTVEPRDEILDREIALIESRSYLQILASDAIKLYNIDQGTKYRFCRVNDVNSFWTGDSCTYYYITYTVFDSGTYDEATFQAKAFCTMYDSEVVFCRPKTNALSEIPN